MVGFENLVEARRDRHHCIFATRAVVGTMGGTGGDEARLEVSVRTHTTPGFSSLGHKFSKPPLLPLHAVVARKLDGKRCLFDNNALGVNVNQAL